MNFIERRNKIQILQQRADIYNHLQDAQQEDQIQKELDLFTTQRLQQTNQLQLNHSHHQQKPAVSVLTTSGLLSLGLDQYNYMTTSAQDFNQETEQQLRKYKTKGVPANYKEQLMKEKEEDDYRQRILFKNDHLKEFENATHQGFKDHNSYYKKEHNMNDEMKQMVQGYKHLNNLKKNDLNTFFEVFVKHRSTLRK